MIYALNVYDLIPEKEYLYQQYITESSQATSHLQPFQVVAAGKNPLKEIKGQTRSNFVIAGFENLNHFNQMMDALAQADMHRLREQATKNYIWTVYEPWDMAKWLSE